MYNFPSTDSLLSSDTHSAPGSVIEASEASGKEEVPEVWDKSLTLEQIFTMKAGGFADLVQFKKVGNDVIETVSIKDDMERPVTLTSLQSNDIGGWKTSKN